MKTLSIIYLCINLPQSEDRRQSIRRQAQQLGLDIQLVEAIHGSELPSEVEGYDRRTRCKTHPWGMSDNEIACVLSHRKALETFRDSGAEYAVVLEDDAQLSQNIEAAVQELIEHVQGWKIVKLFMENGEKAFCLGDSGGRYVRAVFPKKLLWVSVGYLYTREGALSLLEGLRTFYAPADVQIAKVILARNIPTIAVQPPLVSVPAPTEMESTIRHSSGGCYYRRRTFVEYVRYRCSVWYAAVQKWRMRCEMRSRIRRV